MAHIALTMYKNEPYDFSILYRDSEGEPVDITSQSIEIVFRDNDKTLVFDLTRDSDEITVEDEEGRINVSLTGERTDLFEMSQNSIRLRIDGKTKMTGLVYVY